MNTIIENQKESKDHKYLCECGKLMEVRNIVSDASGMVVLSCSCGKIRTVQDRHLIEEFKSTPIINKVDMVPVRESISCRVCGSEFERLDDQVMMSYPPKYSYLCKTCGNSIILSESYPRIIYRDKTYADKLGW